MALSEDYTLVCTVSDVAVLVALELRNPLAIFILDCYVRYTTLSGRIVADSKRNLRLFCWISFPALYCHEGKKSAD
jgi:hypothetical protein